MTTMSRRERLRSVTVSEIKDHARRLLVAGGPPAISLRAIAREMGMTAPAIYRYFPSLDALVAMMVADLFDELRAGIEAARDAHPGDPLRQLTEMARAFRRWSVAHPAEFALMFGNPIPGVALFEAEHGDPDHAGARFGAPFLQAFAEVWRAGGLPTPPTDVIRSRLGAHVVCYNVTHAPDLPVEVVHAYLSAWVRLYGMVALEVFGHLHWAVSDVEPLFELELDMFVAQITGATAGSPRSD